MVILLDIFVFKGYSGNNRNIYIMKMKTKSQKGFIEISLLIAIVSAIFAVPLGAGMVLNEQEIDPIVPDIVQTFESAEVRRAKASPVIDEILVWLSEAESRFLYLDANIEEILNGDSLAVIVSILSEYKNIIETIGRLILISQRLNDYIDYGTLLPAEDVDYLLSLGIPFDNSN